METPSELVADANNGHKKRRGAFLTFNLVMHASLLAYWIFVHVHESSLMAVAKSFACFEHHFPTAAQFPGRFKYLTVINMVSHKC